MLAYTWSHTCLLIASISIFWRLKMICFNSFQLSWKTSFADAKFCRFTFIFLAKTLANQFKTRQLLLEQRLRQLRTLGLRKPMSIGADLLISCLWRVGIQALSPSAITAPVLGSLPLCSGNSEFFDRRYKLFLEGRQKPSLLNTGIWRR